MTEVTYYEVSETDNRDPNTTTLRLSNNTGRKTTYGNVDVNPTALFQNVLDNLTVTNVLIDHEDDSVTIKFMNNDFELTKIVIAIQ